MLNIVFAGNVGGDVTLREVTVRDEQIKVASFSAVRVRLSMGPDFGSPFVTSHPP